LQGGRRKGGATDGNLWIRACQRSLGGRTLVVGVDRLACSKGLVQRLEAFEIFLARNPEWQGKLPYLQITSKNRSDTDPLR
jgi:trehalose 6-phosphate synthase